MKVIRFSAEHLDDLQLQPAQAYFSAAILEPGYGLMLEEEAEAFTALTDDDEVVAIAGVSERWEGHGTAFALISCDAGFQLYGIVRAMRNYLNAAPWRRIEASVDVGFTPGERMLQLLGFSKEGLAKSYTPVGGDCWIYARIRP